MAGLTVMETRPTSFEDVEEFEGGKDARVVDEGGNFSRKGAKTQRLEEPRLQKA